MAERCSVIRKALRAIVALILVSIVYAFWLGLQGGSRRIHAVDAAIVSQADGLHIESYESLTTPPDGLVVFYNVHRFTGAYLPFPTHRFIRRRFQLSHPDSPEPLSPDEELRLRREMQSVMLAQSESEDDCQAVLLPDTYEVSIVWWAVIGNLFFFVFVVVFVNYIVCAVDRERLEERRRAALAAKRCPTCGYDIRHLPDVPGARCPECGIFFGESGEIR